MRFLTIAAPAEGSVREKMSRFLAFALPVQSVDEARSIIRDFTNRYHDARHVCWAYMLGADRSTFLSNDNGEPSGTAGKPILGQINSLELTNVVVIVVRYFGGIKLGTPGLIAAYRAAAREALDAATIIEGREMESLTFTFPYAASGDVMKFVKATPDILVTHRDFDNTCTMTLSIPTDLSHQIRNQLSSLSGVSIT